MITFKNKLVEIIVNSVIVVITIACAIIGCIQYSAQYGNCGMFFVYFTHLSNIFMGITSLLILIMSLKKEDIPAWLALLRWISIVCVLIVFLVVFVILNPVVWIEGGTFYSLYTGTNFWFHLINPILGVILYYTNEKMTLKKIDILYSLIPFAAYSIFYIIFVLICKNKDIYGLTRGYSIVWSVINFFIMYGFSLGISALAYKIKNKKTK